jgi:hypothetical protein
MRGRLYLLGMILAGCMAPEGPGTDSAVSDPTVHDQNLLAGATSSTNWPSEDAGTRPLEVGFEADSALTFLFMQKPDSGMPVQSIRISGNIRIYRAGYIAAFDSVPAFMMHFENQDSLRIQPETLESLDPKGNDSVQFSICITHGVLQTYYPRFVYSKSLKKFLFLPTTTKTGFSNVMLLPHYLFMGFPDSDMAKVLSDTEGSPKFCYYIPGSPYFWQNRFKDDTLFLGPIPLGNFPLRFVKISSVPGQKKKFKLESFELTLHEVGFNDTVKHAFISRWQYHIAEKAFATVLDSEPSIRMQE